MTKSGRCIAFPNIYQHQVQPFKLADPTKAGHRKIVALFLVDPDVTIPSSTDIPDQRREIYEELLMKSQGFRRLAQELRDIIFDEMENGFTRQQAEKFRLDLMGERAVAVKFMNSGTNSRFAHTFNMWYVCLMYAAVLQLIIP